MNLDEETISRKSSGNLATIINQLLVDIDVWQTTPGQLIPGHGCPKCARKNKMSK